jgi:hypothetical protein
MPKYKIEDAIHRIPFAELSHIHDVMDSLGLVLYMNDNEVFRFTNHTAVTPAGTFQCVESIGVYVPSFSDSQGFEVRCVEHGMFWAIVREYMLLFSGVITECIHESMPPKKATL